MEETLSSLSILSDLTLFDFNLCNSCVSCHNFCVFMRELGSRRHYFPLILTIFPPSLRNVWWKHTSPLQLSTPKPHIINTVQFWGLHVNCLYYDKKLLWKGLRDIVICGHKKMPLWVPFLLCSFSRTVAVGFPLLWSI